MVLISIIFVLLHEISAVPVIRNREARSVDTSTEQCVLSRKLGLGTSQFLEECLSLGKLLEIVLNILS